MHRLWEPIIEPLLQHLRPGVVVEVGCATGDNTRNLLGFCVRTGAVLHAVDPAPEFDVDEWKRSHPDTFVFHNAPSLDVLPTIADIDVALIDGDHNWYTVLNELRVLAASRADRTYPVVLLHDVGWPYGRRDLYYDPERVPEPSRHPYRQAGLRPGRIDLDDQGGLNVNRLNATVEGGPRNGVMTAIEDFLEESDTAIEVVVVTGVHDLAILTPKRFEEMNEEAASFIQELAASPPLQALLETLETLRVKDAVIAADRRRAMAALDERVAEMKARLESTAQERDHAQIRIKSLQTEMATHRKSAAAAEARVAALDRAIESAEKAIESATSQRERLAAKLEKLQGRRSVRFALGVASLARPLFYSLRRLRGGAAREKPSTATELPADPVEAIAQDGASLPVHDPALAADVIVCVHDAPDAVEACLHSLVESTNLLRHRLILVDDGSASPTRRILDDFASAYPVTLLRNDTARGYTVAANQGIEASRALFVVLLNSDTVVAPGWIEKLLRCAVSRPEVAVVGPYSNSASWQSIPEQVDEGGAWAVNTLPAGSTVSEIDDLVERWSPKLYPEVPLVNGFCYLMTRAALDRVGSLDEESFPRGYGEEDDFSLRSADEGMRLLIADDCYVYHAKSQSFTKDGRDRMATASKDVLREKHGADTVGEAVARMKVAEDRIRSQEFVGAALRAAEDLASSSDGVSPGPGVRVGWLQPHLRPAGGIRRAIEMTNRLERWGWDPVLIGWDSKPTSWLPILADVVDMEAARTMAFDVLIVSDPDMVWPFAELKAPLKINFHLAPYMRYRAPDAASNAYYERGEGDLLHVANSTWLAEQVTDYTGAPVAAVFPGGVDKRLFHPVHHPDRADVVCSGSKREHKGTDTIERASEGLSLSRVEGTAAGQHDMAWLLNSGRVYVSAAWHEGFNMSALEAMACGVPVVMTDDGGSRDYAVHEDNALVVPPREPEAMRSAIDRLLSDTELRARLIANGIETAWRFDWDTVSADFARFLVEHIES